MTATAKGASKAARNGFSLIPNEKLIELYIMMVKCHMLAERAGKENGARPEATLVGTMAGLLAGDTVTFAGYDLLSGYLRGASLKELFRRFNGSRGSAAAAKKSGAKENAAPESILKVAQANRKKRNGSLVLASCPADWPADPSWRHALEVASDQRLPIVFVCSRPESLYQDGNGKATMLGFPVITVDCHDVVAVHRVASEAMVRARKDGGPTLIECIPYPGGEEDCDPAGKMEKYLCGKGIFDPFLKTEAAKFARELDAVKGRN